MKSWKEWARKHDDWLARRRRFKKDLTDEAPASSAVAPPLATAKTAVIDPQSPLPDDADA